ncbi:MAG: murein biosynthesis integral membrane protein MurJ [Rickettsiales bacterium]|nr:murein biosynthesis integral membrane protein MurJ [Rickettsiales bacterium]
MFIKSSLIFSTLTFLSRIFGFIRDVLIASFFGTSIFADVFTVAFRLPNLFRSTFAEGAFSAAFVPIFSKKLSHDGKGKALSFASNIFAILVIILFVMVIMLEVFMPVVIGAIAPGFKSDPYKFELTVFLTRITTPYLFFISLVAFYSCILNSMNKFFALAFSPVILNIVMIIGLSSFGKVPLDKVIIAGWTVFIGGIIQLLVIIMTVINKKAFPAIKKPNLYGSDVKRFFKNITPAFLSSSVTQLNIWIGTIIATSISGAASIIYFADRIVQLPISLIGVSIGIVILPQLSKAIKAERYEQANFLQNRAIEISLIFSLPCLISAFILAKPIVYILFQRGAFSSMDTFKTAPALLTLALGIPAYVINKIIVSNFFANEKTKAPLKIALVCLIVNVIGNLILIRYLGHIGITITTAFTGWLNTILLIVFSYKRNLFRFDYMIRIKFLKICLSCVFLSLFLKSMLKFFERYIYSSSTIISFSSFSGVILGALFVYLFALSATKTYSLDEIKKLL